MDYEVYRVIAQEEYFRTEAIAALDEEAELYASGESDGRRLKIPQCPDQRIYWQGYCEGLQQFWFKKLNISRPDEI
jgi:hypothetical protein